VLFYIGLHDLAAFKGIYLDYVPRSSIFITYVRYGNFILLHLDLERT